MTELTRKKLEEMLDYAIGQFDKAARLAKPEPADDGIPEYARVRPKAALPYGPVKDDYDSNTTHEGVNYALENAKVALAAATSAATIKMALDKLKPD